MIKVFHAPRSRSLRVIWMAEELGIPYEVETVQFGGPRSEAFKAANPAGTLPALIDGEVKITESIAILQYLADRYGPTDLSVKPVEPGYADYLQFLVLGEGGLAAPLNAVIGTVFFGPEEQRGGNWTTEMVKEGYLRRMRLVTNRLADHEYMAADRFTAADISVCYAVGLGKALGMKDDLPAEVVAYHKRLTARPAFERAAAVGVVAA